MEKLESLSYRSSSYLGPRRLLHWGPAIAIKIILWVASFTIYCDLMYWPISQPGGTIHLVVFLTWVFLVLYYHYQASAIGPGFVAYKWLPKNKEDNDKLQFCNTCQGYKAPRSHHCRKCNRCVMKMDHHCPWINTCCGHLNHSSFTYFLFFAPIGCMHACYILVMSLYYGFNLRWYMMHGNGTEPRVVFNLFTLIGSMFAVGLAIGVTISVGILFIIQLKGIVRNRTGIEDWIEQKSGYRDREADFIYPYDLGLIRNIRQVLFTRDGWPLSDGYTWNVKEGCGQFDLTLEQMAQKEEKKQRSLRYKCISSYSGSFFPITQGLCTCCCFPWSDEARIALSPDDVIRVTRWRKHWLYGDKHIDKSNAGGDMEYQRVRGWFPRRCVVAIDKPRIQDTDDEGDNSDAVKKTN